MNDKHSLQWLKQMRAIWERKSTEELLAVWQRNDRLQWTDDAFTVIGEILAARLGHAPPQQDPPPSPAAQSTTRRRQLAPPGAAPRRRAAVLVVLIVALLCIAGLGYGLMSVAWRLSDCGLQPTSLRRMVSIVEVEAGAIPAGSLRGWPEWEAFKARMLPFDQLWWYEDHGPLQGADGLVVVRFGFPAACLAIIHY